jgi:protein SCO1/2
MAAVVSARGEQARVTDETAVTAPTPPAPRPSRSRWLIVGLWSLLLLAVPVLFLVVQHSRRSAQPGATPVTTPAGALRATGIPDRVPTGVANLMGLSPVPTKDAPDFTLADQYGHPVSLAALKGHTVVLTFMDPHCVDICPIVSQEFLTAYRELGAAAANAVFVAVNVNRDYAKVADVAAFSTAHRLSTIPTWHFVTGSPSALQAVWAGYNITVAEKSAGADIVHTDIIYFIDPSGRERFVANPQVDYTSDGTAYLPTDEMQAWGRGIALVAGALT